MAEHSSIEWTDATWNPVTGCSVVSPGCTNCYAMKLAGTRLRHHWSRKGLTVASKAGPVWNGAVRLNEEWLDQPLRWRRPRRIFVCAHGDLFHESVPDAWIDRVFSVMGNARHHSFQLLTKRVERMRRYLAAMKPDGDGFVTRDGAQAMGDYPRGAPIFADNRWPLPNVWLGVSVEDQARADERIPNLLLTPAAVRFLSVEPLLGAVDLTRLRPPGLTWLDALEGRAHAGPSVWGGEPHLDWVIVGGESGPGARPMHPDWARLLRDQCQAAGVPFFFKQWGAWSPTGSVDVYCHGPEKREREHPNSPGMLWLRDGRVCLRDFMVAEHARRIREGAAHNTAAVVDDQGALAELLATFDGPIENPLGAAWMYRVGKKRAGRLLDEREWNEMPAYAEASAGAPDCKHA